METDAPNRSPPEILVPLLKYGKITGKI